MGGSSHKLDDAPGVIGVTALELPPLPDDVLANPESARVDPRAWFAHPQRPFEIEIGPGKGSFIVGESKAHPEVNYLAIEWEPSIYYHAADRLRRHGVGNVRVLRADASDFLRWRCPSAILRTIHLYYSDPWPKRKHHKNRVVQDRFLSECARVLLPGGELRVVTDHDELWAWDLEHFARWTTPSPDGPPTPFTLHPFQPPPWVGEGETVGTNYERKFRRDDRPPHAAVLRRAQVGVDNAGD